MAVIGKIREQSTLLLIIIGGAMAAFILGDMLSSNMLFGGQGPQYLGEIGGVEISNAEFESEVQKQIETYKEREQKSEIPDDLANQIREQVWVTMLKDRIFGTQYNELGLVVGKAELADLIYGSNPHPQVVQAFTNPNTGEFDPANVIRFIKNLDQDETGNTKKQWLDFEEALKKQALSNKYNRLIESGLYATDKEAVTAFKEANLKYNIKYVVKTYNSEPDSLFNVTEADAKNYYEENSQEFKQEKVRSISYVNFDIVPSAADTLDAKEWIDDVYKRFKVAKDDSLFVSINSENPFDRMLYSKNLLPAGIDTTIMDQDSIGYMEGPELLDDGTYRIIKISDIRTSPDSVKARHILISFQNTTKDSALARVDSIKRALENGADFAALAAQLSQDPSNKQDTGNLGWFRENVMLKAINDTCFKAKVGEYKIVESQIGAHVFQVTDRSPVVKKVQLGIIQRKIEPSRETFNDYFVKANQFSLNLEGGADITELAAQNGMRNQSALVKENDNKIDGLEASRQIIRWAYASKEGAVSEAFTLNGKFVIAKLMDVKEEGIAPFEKAKINAMSGAMRDKKAAKFKEEMKGDDINVIAQNINGTVEVANDINFGSFSIPRIGFEPTLLGKIFSLKEGDLSYPIQGKNGVYVVWVESVKETEIGEELQTFREQIQQGRQSRVNYDVFEALKEMADVKDNRYLFN